MARREASGRRADSLSPHGNVGGRELAGGGGVAGESWERAGDLGEREAVLSVVKTKGKPGGRGGRNKMRNEKSGVKGWIILSANFRVTSLHSAITQSLILSNSLNLDLL